MMFDLEDQTSRGLWRLNRSEFSHDVAQHEGNRVAHDHGNQLAQYSGNWVAQHGGNSTPYQITVIGEHETGQLGQVNNYD